MPDPVLDTGGAGGINPGSCLLGTGERPSCNSPKTGKRLTLLKSGSSGPSSLLSVPARGLALSHVDSVGRGLGSPGALLLKAVPGGQEEGEGAGNLM